MIETQMSLTGLCKYLASSGVFLPDAAEYIEVDFFFYSMLTGFSWLYSFREFFFEEYILIILFLPFEALLNPALCFPSVRYRSRTNSYFFCSEDFSGFIGDVYIVLLDFFFCTYTVLAPYCLSWSSSDSSLLTDLSDFFLALSYEGS